MLFLSKSLQAYLPAFFLVAVFGVSVFALVVLCSSAFALVAFGASAFALEAVTFGVSVFVLAAIFGAAAFALEVFGFVSGSSTLVTMPWAASRSATDRTMCVSLR